MSDKRNKDHELINRLYGGNKIPSENSYPPRPKASLLRQKNQVEMKKCYSFAVLPIQSKDELEEPKRAKLSSSSSASILPLSMPKKCIEYDTPKEIKSNQWLNITNDPQSHSKHPENANYEPTFTSSLFLDSRYLREFQSGNFIYLREKPGLNTTVYDLEVVEHYDIDPDNYYTMSVQGVTHFTKTDSQFYALDQWEKEYQRFIKIRKIPFFQKYRAWKNFRVWRRNIRQFKIHHAKMALKTKLYILNPIFRSALLTLQHNCIQIQIMDLIGITNVQEPIWTITEFEKYQTVIRNKALAKIQSLSNQILEVFLNTCDKIVDIFLEDNKISVDHKMTFMERAALKKECKNLANFLRLGDYIIIDATLSLVSQFIHSIKNHFESNTKETFLLRIQVDYLNDKLSISPDQTVFTSFMERMVKDTLIIVETHERLLGHEAFKMYTSAGSEDFNNGILNENMAIAMILKDDPTFNAGANSLFNRIRDLYCDMESYLKKFDPFTVKYSNNQKKLCNIGQEYGNLSADDIEKALESLATEEKFLKTMPETIKIQKVFILDSANLKTLVAPSSTAVIKAIYSLIPRLIIEKGSTLIETLNNLSPLAMSNPSTPDDFVLKLKHMQKVTQMLTTLKPTYSSIMRLYNVLDGQGCKSGKDDDIKEISILMREGITSLENCLSSFESTIDEETIKFGQLLDDSVPEIVQQVVHVAESLRIPMLYEVNVDSKKALKYLNEEDETLKNLEDAAALINEHQEVLKKDLVEFDTLIEARQEMNCQLRLWSSITDWEILRNDHLGIILVELEIDSLHKKIGSLLKASLQSVKALPQNEAAVHLRKSIENFKRLMPIVEHLRSPHLKDRHWHEIDILFGFPVKEDKGMTLNKLQTINAHNYTEKVASIAVAAQQEEVLQEMFDKITKVWEELKFEVKSYKDSKELFILGSTEDVMVNLDESIVNISTILGSRFASPIRDSVEIFQKSLISLQETLDEWLNVQKNWMYLENVFNAGDIQRQLPNASKLFQRVDSSWRELMKRTNDSPNALSAGTYPGLKELLQSHNENLDQIQKSLEDYLETKRMAFPRFYFLSNDELLEILGQSKDPKAVQPHLRKCFENLVLLEFDNLSPGGIDVIAMISGEGEHVALQKHMKARGAVEDWLRVLESNMKLSVHKLMKSGLVDYDTKSRIEWVLQHPGQVVATVAQMTWARNTELALQEAEGSMKLWYSQVLEELNALIIKIRGSLTKLHRNIIVALITTDVHARDIVDTLCRENVQSANNFIWQQQLRYYWDTKEEDVLIRHSDAAIRYGYEYMGATSRLVITPLTDRCWMTLTGAYGLKLGASPAGPAGTGKTESSKDLAKAMAIQCVVFNCSDQIDYKMMGKLFRGLSQAGNWTCLDEFNRIDIEVLSVVAQQLLILREGRLQKLEVINFMGFQIPLKDHHVIVTMNPGYAGRTELPDNLKICFRPVSMMVPDYALIAEIMLFAEGFGDAKTLSRKMCKLYILCSEQLSQQPHYDYGLRAVKSVLVMAGSLKRNNPDQNEDVTLIQALRDSNLPKFLPQDLPLFQAIVCDLFPGIDIPVNDVGEIQSCLQQILKKNGLQPIPSFLHKVIQLFDTFNVRFGVSIVGSAGVGKTTCYQQLQEAMTYLHQNGSTNALYQTVKTSILNPKCITMGELYGEFHPLTQEWHDGLASSIMREAVQDSNVTDLKWTIFDGPIDALWIENMNTVLDDNMTLCLANGERIKLRKEMRMLFEVMDLAVASPATVSRIGVVYMTPFDLGCMSYIQSWLNNLKSEAHITERCLKRLEENIEMHLQEGLDFIRKMCVEPVPTQDINIVTSFCRLFSSLLYLMEGCEIDKDLSQIDVIFVFSYIWSVGGSIENSSRPAFNEFCTNMFSKGECLPKLLNGSMDLYSFQPTHKSISSWEKSVPEFKYDKKIPYFQLLVPTPDNIRYTFLLDLLTKNSIPCYLTGVTGSGKTVIIQNLLRQLEANGNKHVTATMNFSAQTLSIVSQMTIENKLEKKRKGLLGPPGGKKMVVFVDDINMPAVEEYGAQPPIELLRQILDFSGFYDREKLFWKEIVDTQLLVAAAPAGGGRSHCTPRFIRHFHVLCMEEANKSSMLLMFEAILGGFTANFTEKIKGLTGKIVSSIIEVYSNVCQKLLPTPSKFHYTFNLRDISRVFQGILMLNPSKKIEVEVIHKLWIHETVRIFQDRLNSLDDQMWLESFLLSTIENKFGLRWSSEDIFRGSSPLLFADFFRRSSQELSYEMCHSWSKAEKVLDDQLDDYNMAFSSPMNLVFFNDAIRHVVALTRVLRQPRGNALLIGVGGSGKQSITKLAAFVQNCDLFRIEITRGYGLNEFREDIKVLMQKTGINGQPTAFLFNESQIVDESFVEDINNILNSGEVPNLFQADEKDKIISDMRPIVKEMGLVESRDLCLETFITRVRENLHIVLCMSPVGSALRVRCRAFPSLINCCTIDWYMNWPEDALKSVANRLLCDVSCPSNDIRDGLINMCTNVHVSSEKIGKAFHSQFQRHVYTTPKSYLDLIALFLSTLKEKQKSLQEVKDRMTIGVEKLVETENIVERLKAELVELQPVLEKKAEEAENLLKQVAIDQVEATKVRIKVSADEETVAKQAAEVSEIQADAQRDLDIALPALQNAVQALDSLSKSDITEVKSFKTPPEAVKTVMEAVCILLGSKTDWDTAKKVLGDPSFMEKLKNYDKDNISPHYLKKLAKYVADPSMAVDVVKKVSKAATSLCMWVHAMDVYSKVAKEVEPKREKLQIMNKKLQDANAILVKKQAELDAVNKKVEKLEKDCKRTVEEKKSLADQASQTEKKLIRAAKLMSGLSSEGERWKESVDYLSESIINMIGDSFLSSACISYFGAFTGQYRALMVNEWLQYIQDLNIPSSSPNYSLATTMSSPVEIREWQLNSLPTDTVSTDSAILVTRGQRWPLMIDPQNQAKKWIKTIEASAQLKITRMNNINLLRSLEACIRNGKPLLIEDIGETMEPGLEPVLQKAIFLQGGRKLIHLGDSDIDYDDRFKLYMTTNLNNPHYLPEIFIKVTVINFTVTMDGLENQLLGNVVKREQPDIEKRKAQLVISMAQDRKQLEDIESQILKLLSESSGNVLEDEVLIETLASSNATSSIIKNRVVEAEKTEIEINKAREQYRAVAVRGAIIYFLIADLAAIDSMYQYSLSFFQKIFCTCICDSPKHADIAKRIEYLIDYMTYNIFTNICRGLFEVHKTLFSSLLCCRILLLSNKISEEEWSLFVRGAREIHKNKQTTNPFPDRISEKQWDLLCAMEEIRNKQTLESDNKYPLKGLCNSITNSWDQWNDWLKEENLDKKSIPSAYGDQMSTFQFVLLLKALADDKIQWGMMKLVRTTLGESFCQSVNTTMQDMYNDTDYQTPCIFILSAGADPTSMLLRFAREKGYGDRLHIVSLGQGQGPRAEALIHQSRDTGDWVLLQNCHLAKSWMNSLEKIVDDLSTEQKPMSSDFRLFLTSFPAKYFPVPVLQNGIKLTNEPPRGIRANMIRSLTNTMSTDMYDSFNHEGKFSDGNPREFVWKKLLGGLLFFHAIVQERRKFGALGWNIKYEFNDADLETSISSLQKFLLEQSDIPWDALRYVTGEINYGGRVTDDWDRRCLISILSMFYAKDTLEKNYKFSPSGKYYVPNNASYAQLGEYLEALSTSDSPELFGMHDNAIVTYEKNESQRLLVSILSLEPKDVGGAGGQNSSDQIVLNLISSMESKLPSLLLKEDACPTTFKCSNVAGIDVMDSLATVLSQEMEKFNNLLKVIKKSLESLRQAINGLIVMSYDLDEMYFSFVNNLVPPIWERVGFASLKGLASWMNDLIFRINFFRGWLHNGQPQAFPLSVFFFPQGFLTGTLQNYARKYQTAIDQLNFEFHVLNISESNERSLDGPEDGVHISGLKLEGARWDRENHTLEEPKPNEMFSSTPMIHFLPSKNIVRNKNDYAAPVYKTSVRQGTLSTTGISTNFVVAIYLKTRYNPEYWVLQGAAFILNQDD